MNEFERQYAIDPEWVFLLGLRQSADIALFSALRYPEYFSGAAALRGAFDTALLAPQSFVAIERLDLFFALPRYTSDQSQRAQRRWETLEPYLMDVKLTARPTAASALTRPAAPCGSSSDSPPLKRTRRSGRRNTTTTPS
ncbi:MAG: hypothetical protein JSU73_09830 [candidate division WOR-3 bacterium]|nr:MAG: hypothetical protein JSU73_09830 [candidate division WOR-3 bacterium]